MSRRENKLGLLSVFGVRVVFQKQQSCYLKCDWWASPLCFGKLLLNVIQSVANLSPLCRVTLLQSSPMKWNHCSCHCRLLAAEVCWLWRLGHQYSLSQSSLRKERWKIGKKKTEQNNKFKDIAENRGFIGLSQTVCLKETDGGNNVWRVGDLKEGNMTATKIFFYISAPDLQ